MNLVLIDRFAHFAPLLSLKQVLSPITEHEAVPATENRKAPTPNAVPKKGAAKSAPVASQFNLLEMTSPNPGLYLCGGSTHPGGNITGLCGYNAASVIAADLGLKRWWDPPDLEAALSEVR